MQWPAMIRALSQEVLFRRLVDSVMCYNLLYSLLHQITYSLLFYVSVALISSLDVPIFASICFLPVHSFVVTCLRPLTRPSSLVLQALIIGIRPVEALHLVYQTFP